MIVYAPADCRRCPTVSTNPTNGSSVGASGGQLTPVASECSVAATNPTNATKPIQPGVRVRLATVHTDRGMRLYVRGERGYVDIAAAIGDERLSDLTAVLEGGQ